MIDIENQIFNSLATKLREQYDVINVVGEELNAPSIFPTVSIVESDNYVAQNHIDSSNTEPYANVMYQIDIYSNKQGQKKTECKEILQLIDKFMYQKGFIRVSKQPMTIKDSTIFRMVARYKGVISKDKNIYGR